MSEVLVVVMQGQVAGRITRKAGRLELAYDSAYATSAAATALSVSLPLTSGTHGHAAVAPWLDGLLPDDDAVRRIWGTRFHVSAGSPFSLLTSPIGEECAGAAQFIPEHRVEDVLYGRGEVAWLNESGIADRLRDLRSDGTAWLGNDFSGRFSLAGAQAKTALLFDSARQKWGVPSGAAATSHILKPAIAGFVDHELNEHLCLRTAAACGLIVAPSTLAQFDDQSAVVSSRYDREDRGSRWLDRIHQEDLCQALSIEPAGKYQNEGGPGVREISALLRNELPAELADDGVTRFLDAVMFNWLIGGTDAHAKNYSLLLSGPQARLAPLYDIASALPYPNADIRRMRMAMKFGEDYTLHMRTASMWPKVAKEFTLPVERVRQRASMLIERIPDALRDAAVADDVIKLRSDLPVRLLDAVADRIAQCASTLRASE